MHIPDVLSNLLCRWFIWISLFTLMRASLFSSSIFLEDPHETDRANRINLKQVCCNWSHHVCTVCINKQLLGGVGWLGGTGLQANYKSNDECSDCGRHANIYMWPVRECLREARQRERETWGGGDRSEEETVSVGYKFIENKALPTALVMHQLLWDPGERHTHSRTEDERHT